MFIVVIAPVLWVARWRTSGFLGGVLFLWLCAIAIGLSDLGPGQVDNIIPGLAFFFGWACALFYLGPIYLVSMIWARIRSAGGTVRRADGAVQSSEQCRRQPVPTLALALAAVVAAAGVLYVCWVFRPRHPQHVAIDAIEANGGLVILGPSRLGEPVERVWRGYSRHKLGDAEMKYIAQLTQLRALDLGYSNISDHGLENLKGLADLRELNLSSTGITDRGLEALRPLVKLDTLYLNDVVITDEGLAHIRGMPELRTLALSGTRVTDAGLKHLEATKQLRFVNLGKTRVTEEGVKKLQKALPNCEIHR
jgi:hypothetical protein